MEDLEIKDASKKYWMARILGGPITANLNKEVSYTFKRYPFGLPHNSRGSR